MVSERVKFGGFVVEGVVGNYKNLIDDLVVLRWCCNFGKKMMMSY